MSVKKEKQHIDDAILWALIDPDKLQDHEKKHLQECRVCQDMELSLQQELLEIKQLSREYLPKPKRNLRPVSIEKSVSPVLLRIKQSLVYAFMVMICIGGVFGLWPTQDKAIDKIAMEQATSSIEEMLQTIDSKHENGTYSILPATFQYIVADEFEIMSNPFYDYVFPISTLVVDES